MPISVERLESIGHFSTYDVFRRRGQPMDVHCVQCHYCGFEPSDAFHPPRICPKCYGATWERFTRPGSILRNAVHHG
jgi:predicted Zn-ribbon and HTH transcriptional regulator